MTQTPDTPTCKFTSDALSQTQWLVAQWSGEEGLSKPYRFEVKLAIKRTVDNPGLMLGQTARLELISSQAPAYTSNVYHGIVTELEELGKATDNSGYTYINVVLEPRLALLKQTRCSDIWLDKNVAEIIKDVLAETGLTQEDHEFKVSREQLIATKATFTCQFEESHFDFMSRLLEYFGLFYYFEQRDGREVMMLCNSNKHLPNHIEHPIQVQVEGGWHFTEPSKQLVYRFQRRRTCMPAKVRLQDFSASNARLKLLGEAALSSSTPTSIHEAQLSPTAFKGSQTFFGTHFGSNAQGEALARIRAEALACQHWAFHGTGRAPELHAGKLMRMQGHDIAHLCNVEYHLIEVRHSGSQPLPEVTYAADETPNTIYTEFVALPWQVPFRAPCTTPKPHVQGVYSAIVDGDEATGLPLLDKHGCYKVNFPFVRDDKAATRGSAWLRMATLSSGATHGMHFPLLKGTEVLVSFLCGDPDRPIITGSVPNSENRNVVTDDNPTQSGFSTPGGHFLAIDDNLQNPLMAMGAPAGRTTLTLGHGKVEGHGEINGAQLKTNSHMELQSHTHTQKIKDLYEMSVGKHHVPSSKKLKERTVEDFRAQLKNINGDPTPLKQEDYKGRAEQARWRARFNARIARQAAAIAAAAVNNPAMAIAAANRAQEAADRASKEVDAIQPTIVLYTQHHDAAIKTKNDAEHLEQQLAYEYQDALAADEEYSRTHSGKANQDSKKLEVSIKLQNAKQAAKNARDDLKASESKLHDITVFYDSAIEEAKAARESAAAARLSAKTAEQCENPVEATDDVIMRNLWGAMWGGEDPFEEIPTTDASSFVELNTASAQISAGYGRFKEQLNDFDSVKYVNARGIRSDINLGQGDYSSTPYKKEVSIAQSLKTEVYELESFSTALKAQRMNLSASFSDVAGILSLTLEGWNQRIILDHNGITLETNGSPVEIKGDVRVHGNLIVNKKCHIKNELNVDKAVHTPKFLADEGQVGTLTVDQTKVGHTITETPAPKLTQSLKAFNDYFDSHNVSGKMQSLNKYTKYACDIATASLSAVKLGPLSPADEDDFPASFKPLWFLDSTTKINSGLSVAQAVYNTAKYKLVTKVASDFGEDFTKTSYDLPKI